MKIEKLIKKKSIPSFCTSNLDVLRIAIYFCKVKNFPILIESTSNQVNQKGGYSGKNPKKFRLEINKIGKKINFDKRKLFVGGDHLGPLPWKHLNNKMALKNSILLIDKCLEAKYLKIHIDTSIKCFDDQFLTNEEMFNRTKFILDNIKQKNKIKKIFLVIGTEVPLSGGNDKSRIKLTSYNQIYREVINFKKLLRIKKIQPNPFALVIEPGMKYTHNKVTVPKFTKFKKKFFYSKKNNFVYEAHSTDFQKLPALKSLVKNNFKFLKVGPELTFNFSKAIFFMENIEKKIFFKKKSNFTKNILFAMNEKKKYWKSYYQGNRNTISKLMLNSQLDRMRYYLSHKKVQRSKKILEKNINQMKKKLIIKLLNQSNKKRKSLKIDSGFKLSNFELIVFSFLYITLEKYYKACGFKI